MDESANLSVNKPVGVGRQRPSSSNRFVLIAIVVLLALIGVVSILIVKDVFITPPTAPRTALERDLQYFQDKLKKKPNDHLAHFGIAAVYMEMGSFSKAVEEYKQTVRLKPDYYRAYYGVALALEKMDRMDEAALQLKEVLKVKKDYELAHFELGKISYEQKKYGEAEKSLREALKISGEGADTHYLLGQTYEAMGKKDAAISEYKAALVYIPDYEEAKAALTRISK